MRILAGCFIGCFIVLYTGCCTLRGNDSAPNSVSNYLSFNYYKRVVKLEVLDLDGDPVGGGSGFPIDKDRIMTAGHVCLYAYEGQVRGEYKEGLRLSVVDEENNIKYIEGATIDAIDEQLDICVLKRFSHGLVSFSIAKEGSAKIHDSIMVVGAPLGLYPVDFEGKIIDPMTKDIGEGLDNRLVIAATGDGGLSGGPVINKDGEVIGIVIMGISINHHFLFCATVSDIRKFLKNEYDE